MMLTDANEIEADLLGQHALLDDIAERLRLRERYSVRANRYVAEGIKTQFDRIRHLLIKPRRARSVGHKEQKDHEESFSWCHRDLCG